MMNITTTTPCRGQLPVAARGGLRSSCSCSCSPPPHQFHDAAQKQQHLIIPMPPLPNNKYCSWPHDVASNINSLFTMKWWSSRPSSPPPTSRAPFITSPLNISTPPALLIPGNPSPSSSSEQNESLQSQYYTTTTTTTDDQEEEEEYMELVVEEEEEEDFTVDDQEDLLDDASSSLLFPNYSAGGAPPDHFALSVSISSAVNLERRQIDQIAKKMRRLTGFTHLSLQSTVDPSLIAGFVISYGTDEAQVIDLSVKGQLTQLAARIESSDHYRSSITAANHRQSSSSWDNDFIISPGHHQT